MTDELFDIVDENDTVTGQEMRSVVHQRGLWHRGVHVLLFTADKKLLVQKRSADRVQAPSLLDCSVSEHVKAGEGYSEAAVRGLKEELGLEGIDLEPLLKFKMNYGPDDNEISQLYRGTVDPAGVRFDPVEIERIDFYSLGELGALLEKEDHKFSYWFEQILGWYLGKPSALQRL
jgi:isopentenyldiphosphate isomerase